MECRFYAKEAILTDGVFIKLPKHALYLLSVMLGGLSTKWLTVIRDDVMVLL